MPREARNCYHGHFYHVMTQGINKENIFCSDVYKKIYIKLMSEYAIKSRVKVIAYCIMKNHAHFLLRIQDVKDMSEFMKIINMRFAMLYNEMENRVGVVFRNRYESQLIYNEEYFYNCVNYIHNNPVKARIVEQAKDYEFSSAKRSSLENILQEIKRRKSIKENSLQDFIDVDKESITAERMEEVIGEFKLKNNIQDISLEDKRQLKLLVSILKEKTKAKNTDIAKRLRDFKSHCYKLFT